MTRHPRRATGTDPRLLEHGMTRHRNAFRVGCTLVLNKPWPDFTPAEQVDALAQAHRLLEDRLLLKVPAALLDATPVYVQADGEQVPTLEVAVVIPQPWRLPSASLARQQWDEESGR